MKIEIEAAVNFLQDKLRLIQDFEDQKLDAMCKRLEMLLIEHFENHWYEDKPMKGSAYRCVQVIVDKNYVHPVLLKVFGEFELSNQYILSVFNQGISLWIDPNDVSCQLGNGAIFPIYRKIRNNSERQRPRSTSPQSGNTQVNNLSAANQQRSTTPPGYSNADLIENIAPPSSPTIRSPDTSPKVGVKKMSLNPYAAEFDFKPTCKQSDPPMFEFHQDLNSATYKAKPQCIWQDDEIYEKYHWSRSNNTSSNDGDYSSKRQLQEVF